MTPKEAVRLRPSTLNVFKSNGTNLRFLRSYPPIHHSAKARFR